VRWPAPAQPGAAVLRRVWGAAAGKMIFLFEREARGKERERDIFLFRLIYFAHHFYPTWKKKSFFGKPKNCTL
jgi:hypothetical protein